MTVTGGLLAYAAPPEGMWPINRYVARLMGEVPRLKLAIHMISEPLPGSGDGGIDGGLGRAAWATWGCRRLGPSAPRRREVRKSAAYDHAMGFFRSAMRLFRSGAGKNREEAAAESPEEQTQAGAEPPGEQTQAAAELPGEQTQAGAELPGEQTQAGAELPGEQAKMAKAQPEVAPREVKHEARPNPDKPGWGVAFGQEIRKAREDRGSQE